MEQTVAITLTMNIWTQRGTMRSFLGVTAHNIEELPTKRRLLRSVELCAQPLTERKSIPYLRTVIADICSTWESSHLVITDGGTNIKGTVREEFGADSHVSCFAHISNLIGQSVLKPSVAYVRPSERVEQQAEAPVCDNESDCEEDGLPDDFAPDEPELA
ncbi:hypothetical protein FOCC_FOCC015485 [Frankliniella occidentalis]|nr:hypothetical protein FOCC_FOCC015485 [Frankliniella occidentalis]